MIEIVRNRFSDKRRSLLQKLDEIAKSCRPQKTVRRLSWFQLVSAC